MEVESTLRREGSAEADSLVPGIPLFRPTTTDGVSCVRNISYERNSRPKCWGKTERGRKVPYHSWRARVDTDAGVPEICLLASVRRRPRWLLGLAVGSHVISNNERERVTVVSCLRKAGRSNGPMRALDLFHGITTWQSPNTRPGFCF